MLWVSLKNYNYCCPLSDGAWVWCRTTCKLVLSLFFLCQLIIGKSTWGHRYRLGERRQCSNSSHCRHLGHFFTLVTWAIMACSETIMKWSCARPSFMAWWVGVHDRQLRLHGNLVAHGSAFSLYWGPVAGQKLFLKKESSYFWRMAGICSKILRTWAVSHL